MVTNTSVDHRIYLLISIFLNNFTTTNPRFIHGKLTTNLETIKNAYIAFSTGDMPDVLAANMITLYDAGQFNQKAGQFDYSVARELNLFFNIIVMKILISFKNSKIRFISKLAQLSQ